ncbi:reprolysin-like metallopeptidase [Thiothrix eikelboomii]|uniref:reprolysin-like metallopeptidase n=1 Tax=Thiothrix eikelboomii TaxID=92487 RepID=UPI003BB16A11
MNPHLSKLILTLISLAAPNLYADETLWTDIQPRQTSESPLQQRTLNLNEASLHSLFIHVGLEPRLSLPLPTGGFAKVQLIPVETLSPMIAAQFPDWHTWQIQGLDGQVRSGRAEFTALGFTAMLVMKNGDILFIDPTTATTQAAQRSYRSLSKQANSGLFNNRFQCNTSHPTTEALTDETTPLIAARAGEDLKTYDIAIAATGEYTQYHGGSKTTALSAITTTINRMNDIYQRDLSIKLRLVSGVTTIYSDAATDPYPSSGSNLLTENQTVLDSLIGSENYDLGHLFTTGDGGLAVVEAACRNSYKAQGVSGWDTPTGDIFAIDYVAHEVGHQLGATHTFNSNSGSCSGNNRIAKTAYEPGSGSTIMSYAGICSPDNLQAHSDPMFHSGSINQITAYTQTSTGALCADSNPLNNANPVVNAGQDYTIPARTPFILTGSASDTNTGDLLSYSWEQIDLGSSAKLDVDTGDNALVRAQLPSSSPSRTIPRLTDLLSSSHTYGETLSNQTRAMNFRLQVRDGKGGIGADEMVVNIQDTGSAFEVTAPKNTSLVAGSTLNVTWNVAKTNQAPISCSQVDIALNMTSTTSNENFQTLLSNTPNDGTASVTLPSSLGTKNTIRVKCSHNIFFALSDVNPTSAGNGTDDGILTSGGTGSFPLELVLLVGLGALLRQSLSRSKGVSA